MNTNDKASPLPAAVSPAKGQDATPEQMRAGTCPLTTDTLEALRGTTDQRQLGFIFFCHRQSIMDALSNVLAPASSPAQQREPLPDGELRLVGGGSSDAAIIKASPHPTPWRVDEGDDYCRVLDAEGNVVLPNDITKRALYRRIVEAVSGTARERGEPRLHNEARLALEKELRETRAVASSAAYQRDENVRLTTENQRLKNESESRMNMARLLATQAGKLEARLKEAETVLTTGMMSDRERLRRIQLILAASAPEHTR